jgi:hypothetical protein
LQHCPTKSVRFIIWMAILQAFGGFLFGLFAIFTVIGDPTNGGRTTSGEGWFAAILAFLILGWWFWFCLHARAQLDRLRSQAAEGLSKQAHSR